MALRPLTHEEKDLLFQDADFKNECNWAMIDEGVYWSQLDGTAPPGGDAVSWAKKRTFAVNLILDSNIDVDYYTRQFLILTDEAVVEGTLPFDIQTVIDYMLTNNLFQIRAGAIFDLKKQGIKF